MLTFTQELHGTMTKAIHGLPPLRTVAVEVQLLRAMLEAIEANALAHEAAPAGGNVPASVELRAAALLQPAEAETPPVDVPEGT